MHTSDDSYIYQLSLVLATATVSFLAPYARTTRHEEAFFSLENQGKKARFARAPHYYYIGIAACIILAVMVRPWENISSPRIIKPNPYHIHVRKT